MPDLTDRQRVEEIDKALSHVWMVRTFLKHSEEAEEDDELRGFIERFTTICWRWAVRSPKATMRNISSKHEKS